MNTIPAASEGASDAELLARAAAGESPAASDLYRRHSRAVYRFAWALCGNDSFAADVVQDTFLSLIDAPSGAPAFDAARGSVAAYLCGIARHLVYRRSRDRHDAVEDIESVAESASDAPVPELPHDRLERIRALGQMHEAIRALPPYYRDVLVLVELQQMSYADAAQVVGIEVGTVRSRLSRARKQLAACLSSQTASSGPGGIR
jgi:RNA polymerase sigma-70 factor (ECF subfamily)